MKGYMIYNPQEAVKNQGFIRMFQEKGKPMGMTFEYVSIQDYDKRELPDFVLNRTREPSVSSWYQQRRIPVFHPDELVAISNNKYQTLQYLAQNLPDSLLAGKWCPDSTFLPKEEIERVIQGEKTLPDNMVIKSLSGHGGGEVFLTQSHWQPALRGKDCLLQEKIESSSQDLRVYLLGGEIYQAVLRTGTADFRSNFSLGGTVRGYELNREQKDWIQQFVQAFPQKWLGMLGMDFILTSDQQLIFNEVEEMAGCRMLYQCTSRDIVKDFVAWLSTFV